MSQYPDFFIIGAAKAGTTSLYRYLEQHPDIYFSPIKEPHFFSTDIKPENFNRQVYNNIVINLADYFDQKPLKPLFQAFVRDEEQYLKLFEDAQKGQLKGEASTTYLYSTVAAEHIKSAAPMAKIFVILRNPIERAYSHYLMALKFGFTEKPFLEAVKEDQAKTAKGWGISELFLELGMYYRQLKRYYDLFPAKQIKVILHEDLQNDAQEVLDDVVNFLEVSTYRFDTEELHNTAEIPRAKYLNKYLNRLGLRTKLAAILPDAFKQKLKTLYLKRPSEAMALDAASKAFLRDVYREDIRKTEELTDLSLQHWLS